MKYKKVTVAEIATERICKELEKGVIPWQSASYKSYSYSNADTRKPFSVLNQIFLRDYDCYLTWSQLKDENLKLKNYKSLIAFYYRNRKYRYYKCYPLKNSDYQPPENNGGADFMDGFLDDVNDLTPQPLENCDMADLLLSVNDCYKNFMQKYSLQTYSTTEISGDNAAYDAKNNRIALPENATDDDAIYIQAMLSALVHATGNELIQDRELSEIENFRSGYDLENLIAEIGTAALIKNLGCQNFKFNNPKDYCKKWIDALNNDPEMLFQACAAAQKALTTILKAGE